jgi:hypothetical protein
MSNIKDKIQDLIKSDLKNFNIKTAEDVYVYRDKYFLDGSQDSFFIKYIKLNSLK